MNEILIDVRIKMKDFEKTNEELNLHLNNLQVKFDNKSVEMDKIRRELNSKEKY